MGSGLVICFFGNIVRQITRPDPVLWTPFFVGFLVRVRRLLGASLPPKSLERIYAPNGRVPADCSRAARSSKVSLSENGVGNVLFLLEFEGDVLITPPP